MLNIVIGVIAVLFGLWGITRNWYMFMDILRALIPIMLIVFGTIMTLAGIRNKKKKQA